MFEGFTLEQVDVGDAELRVRHGGSGPPVLLQHKVAPLRRLTSAVPNLPGSAS